MPDERLIQEIENILSEVVALGGQRERTSIVPNMLVRDASPAGQDDYVIIADNRDNDNILALKVPGVVYADNDLVNVIFPEGGEAIAFQQGSGSTTSGLWDVVPGTDDIFYDKGDVGIGKSVAPDAALEILDTSQQQLRLTFQEDTKYADFTVDTNHDLTIAPSSTGIVLIDTSLSIDIGLQKYQLTGRGTSSLIFEAQSSGSNSIFEMFTADGDGTDTVGIRCFSVGTVADISNRERVELVSRPAGTFDLLTEANGTGTLRPLLIYTEGNTDQIRVETDGNVGFSVASPQGIIHAYDTISGFILWEYDGLDATVRTVIPNGTGDVLYRLRATYVMRDSAGAVAGATANVNNGASANLTVGTNTVRLRVNADGSCDVARTAGTDTIKITLMLNWL